MGKRRQPTNPVRLARIHPLPAGPGLLEAWLQREPLPDQWGFMGEYDPATTERGARRGPGVLD